MKRRKLKTFGYCAFLGEKTRNIEILLLDRENFALNDRQYKKALKYAMIVKDHKGKRIDLSKGE